MSDAERKDWEISWHILLQVAVSYLTMGEMTCQRMKIDKTKAANRAIKWANILVGKHGQPGTAALAVATDSLAALRAMGLNGLVPLVTGSEAKGE